MIRTYRVECKLNRGVADTLNLSSGRVYTGVLVQHWRVLRKKGIWLSEKSATRISDSCTNVFMHAHSIDAAQQGFYKACKTAKALRKIDPAAKYPHWTKKFRTSIWKNTALKRQGDSIVLSNGLGNAKITIALPEALHSVWKFLEVRLVYDKKGRRYEWHVVAENGKQPKQAAGNNPDSASVVSVDLGEIHPAVVGDEHEATIITCRERRHEAQGHAKRLAKLSAALSKKKKGSLRYRKLLRTKSRMKAKHERVQRDIAHKISRAIVNVTIERKANTIAMGDIRDIGDEVDLGKKTNQKISGWNHGKVRNFVAYKAAAEGFAVTLVDERYTSQTCPQCQQRHKPRGRNYRCPSCGFQSHRDVVGQVNILSVFKLGSPGNILAPAVVKHRMPHNLRLMRRPQDTGLGELVEPCSLDKGATIASLPRSCLTLVTRSVTSLHRHDILAKLF